MSDAASSTPFNLDELKSAISAGWQPSFLFFWGHTARAGTIGKHVLSQWWPAAFDLDGESFPTVEHYMMTAKARLFGDDDVREKIMAASEPKEAKALGRQVRNFNDKVWVQKRFDIVVRGNIAKFTQNSELAKWLGNTQENVIVEASPYDTIWGIGLKSDDARAAIPAQWRGLNLLGFALMKTREALHVRR